MATAWTTQYRVRNPRATSLYRLFDTHFEEVKGRWEERFEGRWFLIEMCAEGRPSEGDGRFQARVGSADVWGKGSSAVLARGWVVRVGFGFGDAW